MTPKFRIAAITDEFSPDLSVALKAMKPIGMTGAELARRIRVTFPDLPIVLATGYADLPASARLGAGSSWGYGSMVQ